MDKREQLGIEQPMSFLEKARELHNTIVALPDSLGEDHLRGAVNLEGRASAETAATALKALENDQGEAIDRVRTVLIDECRRGLDRIKYTGEEIKSLETAKKALKELE